MLIFYLYTKIKKMKRFIPFLLMILVFSSCHYFSGERVRGDGNVVRQSRNVDSFNGVDVSGAIAVYVKQDSSYSVEVEIDNNLQEYIEVYEKNGILHIHQRNNTSLKTSTKTKVYVSAPAFELMEASGACSITSDNQLQAANKIDIDVSGASHINLDIRSPKTMIDASGAGSIELKGETKDLIVDGSGSTDIKAFELLTESTDVHLSGAGDAEVYASVRLDARISGAASVRYKGNASVNSDISGAGKVKKIE